jgi:hypothetical protein
MWEVLRSVPVTPNGENNKMRISYFVIVYLILWGQLLERITLGSRAGYLGMLVTTTISTYLLTVTDVTNYFGHKWQHLPRYLKTLSMFEVEQNITKQFQAATNKTYQSNSTYWYIFHTVASK